MIEIINDYNKFRIVFINSPKQSEEKLKRKTNKN